MIIITKNVNIMGIIQNSTSKERLIKYVEEQYIPPILKNMYELVDNQYLYIALKVREYNAIPWKKRKEIENYLSENRQFYGVMNELYVFNEIIKRVGIDQLKEQLMNDIR